jgi:hypothetical protein
MALARNTFQRRGFDDPRRNKDKRQLFSNFAILLMFAGRYQLRFERPVRFSDIDT